MVDAEDDINLYKEIGIALHLKECLEKLFARVNVTVNALELCEEVILEARKTGY